MLRISVHVFWDNSNIWLGAQAARLAKEPEVPAFTLRVYFKNLYEFVSHNRPVSTKVMAGSVPPEADTLWDYARGLGFNMDLLKRVTTEAGNGQEQGVDEIMHLKIANAVADHTTGQQTLVLLSGDGRNAQFGTSFPGQIERALRVGWDVEVYSWRAACNRKFDQMAADNPTRVKLVLLDDRYEQLTFIRGGEYHRISPEGERIYFVVPNRVVQPLTLL